MNESEKHSLEHLPTGGEIAGTAEKSRLKEIEKNLTEGFESYIAAKKATQNDLLKVGSREGAIVLK